MYTIARATDASLIGPFAAEFTQSLGEPCDVDYYVQQWKVFFSTGIGVAWYMYCDGMPVGGIGGIIAPDLLSGQDTLIELFWYVTPQHRRRGILLFRAMESFVTERHMRWAMIHMERSMPGKLKTFYEREGFRLLETHWIKET